MRAACVLCFVVALAWCLDLALYPDWKGAFYHPDPSGLATTPWREGGFFGLEGSPDIVARAPVWNPPVPHADIIHASVRWPWQPPSQAAHVEIVMSRLLMNWMFAIVTMGAVLRLYWQLFHRETQHGLVTVWWTLTIALTVGWVGLLVLAVVTLGYGAQREVISAVPVIAGIVGLVVGVRRYRRMKRMAPTQAAGPA